MGSPERGYSPYGALLVVMVPMRIGLKNHVWSVFSGKFPLRKEDNGAYSSLVSCAFRGAIPSHKRSNLGADKAWAHSDAKSYRRTLQ